MKWLIRGGRVIDSQNQVDDLMDIYIHQGRIMDLQPVPPKRGTKSLSDYRVIPAEGLVVCPGLIDIHTHLREPGFEYKETILTGTRAAVTGGFTAVACMANTLPVNDNQSVTEYILNKAKEARLAKVFPVGAISAGLKGEALAEYGELKTAGVVALSDDGNPVMNSQLMRRAMEYAQAFDLPIIAHCEDLTLSRPGVMNEGPTSTRLGLHGIPSAAEEIMIYRDIQLCQMTQTPLHIAHISTAGSVQLIREAKKKGLPVSAETAPHHFSLTEEAVIGFDTLAKMNPPLRTKNDLQAIQKGLKDGTIEVIASDHAPQSALEKEVEFDQAAMGIIGLETTLPLTLNLVHRGILTLPQAIAKLTQGPARILNLPGLGRLEPSGPADLTIIDPDLEFQVDIRSFVSKSKNSPFHGWTLKGKAVLTMVEGRVVFNQMAPMVEE
ncbi:MAG: dihydroorotase [Deltaproteobacteria bacterium RBG_13_43_22]|nr:MAG: dihydroorotase [Deltaproteobacteria bacterium RBG_13_43_22]